jgi:hypothetical protein
MEGCPLIQWSGSIGLIGSCSRLTSGIGRLVQILRGDFASNRIGADFQFVAPRDLAVVPYPHLRESPRILQRSKDTATGGGGHIDDALGPSTLNPQRSTPKSDEWRNAECRVKKGDEEFSVFSIQSAVGRPEEVRGPEIGDLKPETG